MKAEIQQFMGNEQAGERNSRNGYYKRSLHTKYGNLENLEVPRDRNGDFQTQMFEPYQRRDGWLEEAVIQMYKSGMGTRDVARFIESMFGSHYSPATVSNITATVLEDIQKWQMRPLQKRYSVIYLDGFYVKLKRSTVSGEVVYFAMGIDEDGHRQILGFYVGGQESANGWRDVLKDLYNRGAQEVLLGVFDGPPGLDVAFREMYPKEMRSWEEQLSTLLSFYKYPVLIKEAIYTSNSIERMNKEIRKRLKPVNSLTNMDAAEKIVYLEVMDYNERFTERVLRGFGELEVKKKLSQMFEDRYPTAKTQEAL